MKLAIYNWILGVSFLFLTGLGATAMVRDRLHLGIKIGILDALVLAAAFSMGILSVMTAIALW